MNITKNYNVTMSFRLLPDDKLMKIYLNRRTIWITLYPKF